MTPETEFSRVMNRMAERGAVVIAAAERKRIRRLIVELADQLTNEALAGSDSMIELSDAAGRVLRLAENL